MKTILIIEDNLEIRENTGEILELIGYKVISAKDGKEGVRLALQLFPDVILCDIVIPLADGYEVLQDLRKQNSTARIPFIYLTARTEKSDIKKAMEMGADGYICKPFDVNELTDAIHKCLKK